MKSTTDYLITRPIILGLSETIAHRDTAQATLSITMLSAKEVQ